MAGFGDVFHKSQRKKSWDINPPSFFRPVALETASTDPFGSPDARASPSWAAAAWGRQPSPPPSAAPGACGAPLPGPTKTLPRRPLGRREIAAKRKNGEKDGDFRGVRADLWADIAIAIVHGV